jgi:hypothetical protein
MRATRSTRRGRRITPPHERSSFASRATAEGRTIGMRPSGVRRREGARGVAPAAELANAQVRAARATVECAALLPHRPSSLPPKSAWRVTRQFRERKVKVKPVGRLTGALQWFIVVLTFAGTICFEAFHASRPPRCSSQTGSLPPGGGAFQAPTDAADLRCRGQMTPPAIGPGGPNGDSQREGAVRRRGEPSLSSGFGPRLLMVGVARVIVRWGRRRPRCCRGGRWW